MSSASATGYAGVAGHWDEMALPSGELRPHWRQLMGALQRLGRDEALRRWREADRLIRENGVTYNVYGDPLGMDRPWQLDPLPLVLPIGEWSAIEAAVTQRAMLLDRMLADLYGPQRLLREGHLPAELVFAHAGFLRPCHGLAVPHDVRLHLYAADLARSPDGQWWVLADRTQAPSGAGYALENRVVTTRVLPEVFGGFHIPRLAGWFQTLRDSLTALATERTDAPRIVLLTPGPYNETYFEHAYLARYLGVTLVEGADLAVRGERVHLKTLDGLLPVDVILRRQDDRWCDPLELYGESALGVPGLVQAARTGNVAVANALGSGLVDTPGVMAFLPGLCRQLLGEALRMPSVATWWCGQQRELEYVQDHLGELVLKNTFRSSAPDVVFGGHLAGGERAAFLARLRADPHRWVAQEQVALSTVPAAASDGPAPRHLVLRVFAVASNGSWSVMPGGLTRVSGSVDDLVVSSQRGGGSKDTWVLADAPVPVVSLLDRVQAPIDVSRAGFALTSRVADNLLWLGRTAERVEAGVRLFRSALGRLADEPLRAADAALPDAVQLLARRFRLDAPEEQAPLAERIVAAIFDSERPDSMSSAARELQRLAWLVRDRISTDAWRILGRVEERFEEPAGLHPALRVNAALERLDGALLLLSAFTGLAMESMTRALGWTFLDIGRRLERAIQMGELLLHGLVEPGPREWRRLENVLQVADSVMTYRSRYQTSVQAPLVLDLLLRDEANPRSVAFQLAHLQRHFEPLDKAPHAALTRLLESVRSAPLDQLAALDDDGRRAALEALLMQLTRDVPAIFAALSHAYLSHAVSTRQTPGRLGKARS